MKQRRWFIGIILIIGLFTVGRKRLEPLWDTAVHDPAIGVVILVAFLLLSLIVIRIIQN